VLPAKVVPVVVVVALVAKAVLADKLAQKAAQVALAMDLPHHVAAVPRKAAHAAIVKIVLKEVLMARHRIASTTGAIVATNVKTTATMTGVLAAMNYHVTLTRS
jgi:hypothetical protein